MNIKNHLKLHHDEYYEWIVNNKYGEIHFKILPYLSDIENGFFIEAGAYDGLHQSNTKILEDCGWTGVLIEPSLAKSRECYNNRSKNTIILNCALVSKDSEKVYGKFGAATSKTITDYIERDGIAYSSSNFEILDKVESRTLASIINELKISQVDFLSLDTEGFELEILKGIDFDKVTFKYILIEHNSNYSLNNLNSFLFERGYINIGKISNFDHNTPGWPGNHQDYLFKNISN